MFGIGHKRGSAPTLFVENRFELSQRGIAPAREIAVKTTVPGRCPSEIFFILAILQTGTGRCPCYASFHKICQTKTFKISA